MSRTQTRPNYFADQRAAKAAQESSARAAMQFGPNTAAKAYRSTGQSLSAGTNKVALDAAAFGPSPQQPFDVSGAHRYNVPATGRYSVHGQVEMNFAATNTGYFYAAVYKNGALASRGLRALVTTTDIWASPVSDLIDANAGDYFELWAYVAWPANLNIAGSAANYFSVVRVA